MLILYIYQPMLTNFLQVPPLHNLVCTVVTFITYFVYLLIHASFCLLKIIYDHVHVHLVTYSVHIPPLGDLFCTYGTFWWFTFNRLIGRVGRVFVNDLVNLCSIPGRVILKTLRMVLNTSLLITLGNIRYVSRVKWSNSGKGVAPSPYTSVL